MLLFNLIGKEATYCYLRYNEFLYWLAVMMSSTCIWWWYFFDILQKEKIIKIYNL